VSDPTRVRSHYSLSAREVDILQCALTALATHSNGMGDVELSELAELSGYLGVIPIDAPAGHKPISAPPAAAADGGPTG